jgi:hypothetical protein
VDPKFDVSMLKILKMILSDTQMMCISDFTTTMV